MKLISLISLSALLLGTSVLSAQTEPCGTDIHRQKLHKLYPENISLEESMEKNIASMPQVENRAAIYTIPVVFHVIHTNGEENISREQILDQMRVLNQDFNLLNPNLSKLRSVFKGLEAELIECTLPSIMYMIWTMSRLKNSFIGITKST